MMAPRISVRRIHESGKMKLAMMSFAEIQPRGPTISHARTNVSGVNM